MIDLVCLFVYLFFADVHHRRPRNSSKQQGEKFIYQCHGKLMSMIMVNNNDNNRDLLIVQSTSLSDIAQRK